MARAGGEAEGWEGWQRAATGLDPKAQPLAPITFAAGSILGTKKKGKRPAKACFARTAPGKMMKVTYLGPPLLPLIMEFMFGKNARGSPLSPSL